MLNDSHCNGWELLVLVDKGQSWALHNGLQLLMTMVDDAMKVAAKWPRTQPATT